MRHPSSAPWDWSTAAGDSRNAQWRVAQVGLPYMLPVEAWNLPKELEVTLSFCILLDSLSQALIRNDS